MLMSTDIKKNNLSIKSRYRPEIDGLRAFAVVAVMINHFNKEILPSGYLGVDIFFVISGFVITSSLYKRPSKNFKDFISGFYERRIKRLVPAISVFVLIMSVAICFFNPNPSLSLKTGLTSLFGFSNLYLLKQSTDYFAQSTELNVFTHTWSLGVEEQFYIMFPFLIWFSGFGRQTKNGARNLFLTIGALAIASLIGFLYFYPINQSAAYFLMPTRFWEMAAGCLLFITFQKRASLEKFLEKVPPLLVLGLIVGIMYLPMSLATTSTVIMVILSLILIASLKKGTASYTFFTDYRVVYIGLISYSLYLWHWGVLSISRWTIGIHWWSIPFQVALIFGLAITSYRYIETPLRKGKWFGKRWKTIFVGGGVIISLSGCVIALAKPMKGKLFIGGKALNQIPKHLLQYENLSAKYGSRVCNIFSINLEKANLRKTCGIYTNDNIKTIWNVGDSHAARFTSGVNMLASENHLNSINLWGNACLFPQAIRSSYSHPAMQGKDCFLLSGKIEQIILGTLSDEDIVIISVFSTTNKFAFRHRYEGFIDSFADASNKKISDKEAIKDYFQKLSSFIDAIANKGAKAVLYTNPLRFDSVGSGKKCEKYWFNALGGKKCLIELSKYNQDIDSIKLEYEKILKNNPDVIIANVQLGDACNETHCDGFFYSDHHHMQPWYASGFIHKILFPLMDK